MGTRCVARGVRSPRGRRQQPAWVLLALVLSAALPPERGLGPSGGLAAPGAQSHRTVCVSPARSELLLGAGHVGARAFWCPGTSCMPVPSSASARAVWQRRGLQGTRTSRLRDMVGQLLCFFFVCGSFLTQEQEHCPT